MKSSILIRMWLLIGLLSVISSCNHPSPFQNGDEFITKNLSGDAVINGNLKNVSNRQNDHFKDEKTVQNIELTILPQGMRVQNDSLYFRYRLQNNSDTAFVLYNSGLVGFVVLMEDEKCYYYNPGLGMFIYEKSSEFYPQMVGTLPPFQAPNESRVQSYEERIESLFRGKYIVLNPGDAVEYDRQLYLKKFELEKGVYKCRLGYIASPDIYYEKRYAKDLKNNNRLKGCKFFEGEVRSNICSFEIVTTMQR